MVNILVFFIKLPSLKNRQQAIEEVDTNGSEEETRL
jgi:hypothetical protein